jgi:MinD-like ATPase involved in chromosome partitioning or flagellar assembly
MYCLLCHEKISRIRYWRTKSEFCCDEHAATHRRQTLERLVGHVAPTAGSDDYLSSLSRPTVARGEESDAPPLPGDSLEAGEPIGLGEMADAAGEAMPGESSEEEFSLDAEWLQTEYGRAAEAAEEEQSAETGISEADLAEDEEDDSAEESGEHAAYFEGTSVQRDEPFPVEILTAESGDEDHEPHRDREAGEPIEPAAAADASDHATLLESLPAEASGSDLGAETLDSEAAASELIGAESETAQELAQAILERENAATPEEALEPERETAAPLPQTDEAARSETPGQADSTGSTAQAQETAETLQGTERAASGQKAAAVPGTARPAKGLGLKPVKTWDPSRGRKRRSAGRPGAMPAGNAEGLNQLAEGLGERPAKVRSTGLGSEIQREDGRKSVLVCFLPVQGGNGASTVSLHVAEAISHHLNERVLLADFDFHSGTLAFRLGLKPVHTLGDVFEWGQNKDQLWESVVCRWKKLDVLVAPPSNSSIHPHGLDKLPDIFRSALHRYPYVIVDHPDAIYSSSRHILTLSDLVYLVCTPEITSLHLARRKVQQIRAMGVPGERLRLIVNRAGSWGSLGVQDIGKIVGVPVSWALNNDYAALRDAVWNGGLVQDGSELAKQLRELGWSVMGVDAPVAAESAAPAEVGSPVG